VASEGKPPASGGQNSGRRPAVRETSFSANISDNRWGSGPISAAVNRPKAPSVLPLDSPLPTICLAPPAASGRLDARIDPAQRRHFNRAAPIKCDPERPDFRATPCPAVIAGQQAATAFRPPFSSIQVNRHPEEHRRPRPATHPAEPEIALLDGWLNHLADQRDDQSRRQPRANDKAFALAR